MVDFSQEIGTLTPCIPDSKVVVLIRGFEAHYTLEALVSLHQLHICKPHRRRIGPMIPGELPGFILPPETILQTSACLRTRKNKSCLKQGRHVSSRMLSSSLVIRPNSAVRRQHARALIACSIIMIGRHKQGSDQREELLTSSGIHSSLSSSAYCTCSMNFSASLPSLVRASMSALACPSMRKDSESSWL